MQHGANNDAHDMQPPQRLLCSRQLPVELITLIIKSLDNRKENEHVYKKCIWPALKACSLVSPTWNTICQPYMFHTFTIDLYKSTKSPPILRLFFLHFTAPHLYKYIRNLNIIMTSCTHDDHPWIPLALPLFVNLHSLSLHDQMSSSRPTLPEPLALGIMNLLALVQLKKISLSSWNIAKDASDLLLLLSACSSMLEDLSLVNCCISNYGQGTMPKPTDPVPRSIRLGALRNLELTVESKVIAQLKQIDMPNLHSLTCAYEADPFHELSPWMPATLSKLTLQVSPNSDLPRLGQSLRLSWLTIAISQSRREPLYRPLMVWIKDCLECLPLPTELRHLNIKTKGHYNLPADPQYPTRGDCEELYHGLHKLNGHGALERINIAHQLMSLSGTYPDDSLMEAAMLTEVFAPLLEACSLVVDITLTQWCSNQYPPVVFLRHRLQR